MAVVHRGWSGLRRATNVVAGRDPGMVQQIGRDGLGVSGQGGNVDRAVLIDEFSIRQSGLQIGRVDLDGRRDLRFGDLQGAAADLGDMAKRGARRDQEQAGQKQGMARDGDW